ncbi:hypothetical protein Dimus_025390 [Dionaea muscipula]
MDRFHSPIVGPRSAIVVESLSLILVRVNHHQHASPQVVDVVHARRSPIQDKVGAGGSDAGNDGKGRSGLVFGVLVLVDGVLVTDGVLVGNGVLVVSWSTVATTTVV